MAKLGDKLIRFNPVADAQDYYVRLMPQGTPFDYAHPPGVTEHEIQNIAGADKVVMNLADAGELAEGTYSIFVTAVDGSGNESDPLVQNGVIMDFTPPAVPTDLEILF